MEVVSGGNDVCVLDMLEMVERRDGDQKDRMVV